jgi:HEAT repeat protein
MASAWALGQVGSAALRAVPALIKALGDGDRRVRWNVEKVLAAMGEPALKGIISGTSDESPDVRMGCAATLERMGLAAEKALPDLIRLIGDGDARVRMRAARALGAVGSAGADAAATVVALQKALADKAWPVRWAAARSLGELGPMAKPALRDLRTAMKDLRQEVVEAATGAMEKINKG